MIQQLHTLQCYQWPTTAESAKHNKVDLVFPINRAPVATLPTAEGGQYNFNRNEM
jgi:hypothetical protein